MDFNGLYDYAVNIGSSVKVSEPMSKHTTFKIGGNATLFIQPGSVNELCLLVKKANELGIKLDVIGNGSNMLISDGELQRAFVNLSSSFSGISLTDENILTCGAGANLSNVCTFAMQNSLTGLEFAFGIPGSVGGAAFMNAGAYEGEVGNAITEIHHVDAQGNIGSLTNEKADFSYRNSAYKTNGCIITGVVFSLKKGNRSEIEEKMNDYMDRRKSKQPLEYPSAGSFFKRPQGHFAGALIEGCGLKGTTVGGAQISEKHAGFIINVGGATCGDVLKLMEHTQNVVFSEKGVMLEPEVLIIK